MICLACALQGRITFLFTVYPGVRSFPNVTVACCGRCHGIFRLAAS